MSENIAFKLTTDASQSVESVKSLKAQLREASEDVVRLSQQFGATSQQAVNAARSAAGLREQIADSRDLIAAFHPEQKFAAFGAAIQGVTGGFSALTGAMGLFGADSENLQKTLVKVQSAMALSEGINSILSAKDAFMNLGAVVKGPIVAAFNFMKMALMTNPIMLLVTVLAGVVLSFKKTRDAIVNFIPGLKQVTEFIGNVIDTVKEWIGASDSAAEAQEKLKAAIDDLNQSLDEELAAIDKATERLKVHAEFAGKSQAALDALDNQAAAKKKEHLDKMFETAKAMGAKGEDFEKFKNERYETLQIEAEKKEITRRKSHATNTKAIVKQKVDEEVILENQAIDKIQARIQAFNDWVAGNKAKEDAAKAEAIKLQEERDKADVARNEGLTTRLNNSPQLAAIKVVDKANKEASDAEIELRKNTEAAKFDIINAGLGAVSELIGKETAVGKGIAVAQAIINTYQGATKALATYAPPFGAIAAGTVIAAGLANVKKIISTKIPGQSGGGGSVPSAASVPAPIQPQAQVSNTRIDQGQVNALGNATVRAFVTETDVTGNQERIKRLNRAARI